MGFTKIPKDALFGIFYVKSHDGEQFDSYYRTINLLSPLLSSSRFSETIIGFYLNFISQRYRDPCRLSIRISYFVSKSRVSDAQCMFREFLLQNGLTEAGQENPLPIVLAKDYGGPSFEEPFRNFLNLQNRIGLELINGNLLYARCLFATYRWQVRIAGLPIRAHFEPAFRRYSQTYNDLSDSEKDQFFLDLQVWPNPHKVDWAHFMVNLVLGDDWHDEIFGSNYIPPEKPLSIPEINMKLKERGFQIPLDWKSH